jgi:hypothetical protein
MGAARGGGGRANRPAPMLKELETFRTSTALQAPANYNLDQIIQAIQEAKHISHVGESGSQGSLAWSQKFILGKECIQ